ncbi:MAG: TRAP transporter small permease subunit [Deltaproteobacteria bacterium]|nr:TRAP transporter small permease subunit [Deltaproteobacteria bacterium]
MDQLARTLDEQINRVERLIILIAVAGMTLLVGADVVQRTFSRPVGKTEQLVAWLGEALAGPLSPEARAALEGPVGGAVFLVLAVIAFVFAAHAARLVTAERAGTAQPALLGSALRGLAVLAGCALAVKLLLWAFPSSVPGAQRFALGLMLWAGMLGASVATRERRHIVLDTVVKKLDADTKGPVALVSGLVTGAFCGVIALLSGMQLAGEIHEWATNEGVGLYESLPIPTWIATLAIPMAFTIMGARFVGYGIRDFRFGPPSGGDGGHGVDLDELQQQTVETGSEAKA